MNIDFFIDRSKFENEIILQTLPSVGYGFNALPNQTDHLLYQISLESGKDKYQVAYFEYRSNPVIRNITSRMSILR